MRYLNSVLFSAIVLSGLSMSCGKSDAPSPPQVPAPPASPPVPSDRIPEPQGEVTAPMVRQRLNSNIATVKASAAYEKKHPVQNAFDRQCATAWNAPYQQSSPPWLEVTFAEPVSLAEIVLTAGWQRINGKDMDLFSANMQVRKVTLLLDEKVQRTVETQQGQRVIEFKGLGETARKVRLQFDQMWNGTKWQDLAISEVEIWGWAPLGTAVNDGAGTAPCDFKALLQTDETVAPKATVPADTRGTAGVPFSNRFRNALADGAPLASFFADQWVLVYSRSHRCDGSTDGSLAGLRSAQIDEVVSLTVRDDGKGWTCKPKKPKRRKMDFSLKALLTAWDRFEVQPGNSDVNVLILVGEAEAGYIKAHTMGSGSGVQIVKFEYHDEDPG